MGPKERLSTDTLRERLRAGDPSRGDELSADEIVETRQRLTSASTVRSRGRAPVARRVLMAAAAGAVAIVIGAYVLETGRAGRPTPAGQTNRSSSERRHPGVADALSAIGPDESLQQIRMTAPGGTRIVWVLRSQPPH